MRHLLALLVVLIGACQWLPRRTRNSGHSAQVIGRVEMVSPDQQFVLMRCEPAPQIASGTRLWSKSALGRRCELRLGGERKGYYLVADAIKELPEVGDEVLLESADLKSPQ